MKEQELAAAQILFVLILQKCEPCQQNAVTTAVMPGSWRREDERSCEGAMPFWVLSLRVEQWKGVPSGSNDQGSLVMVLLLADWS